MKLTKALNNGVDLPKEESKKQFAELLQTEFEKTAIDKLESKEAKKLINMLKEQLTYAEQPNSNDGEVADAESETAIDEDDPFKVDLKASTVPASTKKTDADVASEKTIKEVTGEDVEVVA